MNHIKVKILSVERCERLVGEHIGYYKKLIHICVKGEPTQGICLGDSGSPLFVEYENKLMAVGLSSFSFGDENGRVCFNRYPSMFTNIQAYAKWIESVIKNNTCTQPSENINQ